MARDPAHGFTLIEVLVAISLLALLAIITWHGLGQIIAQRARVDDGTAETDRVLRTLAQVERDVGQRVPDRLFAGRYGVGGVLPLALQIASTRDGSDTLSVLRMQRGSGARGVTYAIEESRLMRSLGEALDQPSAKPVLMLDRVRRFDVRVLMGGQWVAPQEVQANLSAGTGNAVQITIEREDGTRYVQVLAL
jgi:general secretion pathway protein J